jgi:hypothetical protein
MFSRDQLKRAASLTEEDFVQLGKCRRPHNRLGFAYQVAFVRVFDRFPRQQPFELVEELVCFSAAQLRLDARLIELYRGFFSPFWSALRYQAGTGVSCAPSRRSL